MVKVSINTVYRLEETQAGDIKVLVGLDKISDDGNTQ